MQFFLVLLLLKILPLNHNIRDEKNWHSMQLCCYLGIIFFLSKLPQSLIPRKHVKKDTVDVRCLFFISAAAVLFSVQFSAGLSSRGEFTATVTGICLDCNGLYWCSAVFCSDPVLITSSTITDTFLVLTHVLVQVLVQVRSMY